MVSTLLVIGGVLVGLLVLLALIVSLSARPATTARRNVAAPSPSWVGAVGPPAPGRVVGADPHQRDARRPLIP